MLALANFTLYLGFNIWRAVFNNFAVEEIGVGADQIGIIQSIREVPGLLGFALGILVLLLSEMRVLSLSVLLMGLGLIVSGYADTLSVLILGTLVMSIGFHFFLPSNSSLVLMATRDGETPKTLGRLSSVGSLAAVAGTFVIWLLATGIKIGPVDTSQVTYRHILVTTGVIVSLGSLLVFRSGQRKGFQRERRKIVFRRDYWLYYALTFLMGSRRHIFTTFAIFMLVDVYGIELSVTAALFFVNNLVSTPTATMLGWVVARFGERKVLTFNFVGLILVFIGYAFIPILSILYVLFVLDHVFFGFNVAVDSYFRKIARSEQEITSNLSLAQTINHVSALFVPVLGGILWEQIAPSATFLAGAAIAAVSLVLVQFIRAMPSPESSLVAASEHTT
jgi:MFS family permease